MGIISAEEAKARLSECNVLIKYMNFLQANGFTDCGKGQILGQVSLIKECLRDNIICEEGKVAVKDKDDSASEEMGVTDKVIEDENDQSTNLKGEEQATERRSGYFKQITNLAPEGSRDESHLVISRRAESPTTEFKQLTNENAVRTDDSSGLNSKHTEALVTKDLNGSWLDKIKRITEIEEWR